MAAKRLYHSIIAYAGGEVRASAMPKHSLLWVLDSGPLAVIADNADDRDLVPRHRLKLHAVQAEAAVTQEERYLLLRVSQLGGDGKARTGSKRPHRAGIQPMSRLP